jgi:hypothetical protein
MSGNAALKNLFKPAPNKIDAKARQTNQAAWAIIDSEAVSRQAKTAKLRKARLTKEAEELADKEVEAKSAPPKKAARSKRS